jgi:hypothetical protein
MDPRSACESFMKFHFVGKSLWYMQNNNGVKQRFLDCFLKILDKKRKKWRELLPGQYGASFKIELLNHALIVDFSRHSQINVYVKNNCIGIRLVNSVIILLFIFVLRKGEYGWTLFIFLLIIVRLCFNFYFYFLIR